MNNKYNLQLGKLYRVNNTLPMFDNVTSTRNRVGTIDRDALLVLVEIGAEPWYKFITNEGVVGWLYIWALWELEKLPLTADYLEVGKLYSGSWRRFPMEQAEHHIWMQSAAPNETTDSNAVTELGTVVSLECFMVVNKLTKKVHEHISDHDELWFKILTKEGQVGWIAPIDGVHTFKELAGE